MFILWAGFIACILLLLILDLGVFHKKNHRLEMREALLWSTFWVGLGLAFTGVIYLIYANEAHIVNGPTTTVDAGTAALRYLTGYLLEKSLSVDNLFVIALIFESFKVPEKDRHRVLFWGIVGALVFRGAMIIGGVYLVTRFTWLFYVFGAYLLYVSIGLLKKKESHKDASNNLFVRAARRVLPISDTTPSGRFTCRINGQLHFTTLLLALLAIEAADVIFALDSIPAVLAISTDTFIVFTSNVFAILGLRSLFFVLSDIMGRFAYLKISLAAILAYIGLKMMLHAVVHIPNVISLLFIAFCLGIGIAASLRRKVPRD